MIDTNSFRSKIISFAIRGKLTHQDKYVRSVESAVSEIKILRTKLIKEKKAKISKVSEIQNEIPFDIPNSWKWIALGDMCIMLSRGKSPKYSEVEKYPVFAQKCNQPNGLALDKARFLDKSTLNKWPEYFHLQNGDVVINSTGIGTVGRIGFYSDKSLNQKYPFMLPDSHVTVVRVGKGIIPKYIYYALRSKELQTLIEDQLKGSTNQKELYIDSVYSLPIPMPPTEEQKDIVNLIDSIASQLDSIDALQSHYADNISALNKKILELAVQGKLVPQDPSDEPASVLLEKIAAEKQKLIQEGKIKKQKKLPAIAEDEIPFEIPESWKWVRMKQVASIITDGEHSTPKRIKDFDGYYLLSARNVRDGYIQLDDVDYVDKDEYLRLAKRCNPKKGDVLISCSGSVGRCTVVEDNNNYVMVRSAAVISPIFCNPRYLMYAVQSECVQKQINSLKKQTAQANLFLGAISELIIPIPPIEEQNEIVEQLDILLQEVGNSFQKIQKVK